MIEEEIIGLNLNGFESSEDILNYMSDYLETNDIVEKSFSKSLIERENQFPTGLMLGEYGVAIPHTDVEHVKKDRIALATLKSPIIFKQMGGGENEDVNVRLICMLVLTNSEDHLSLLQKLMELFQDNTIVNKIIELDDSPTNQDVVRDILREHNIIA